MFFAAMLHSHLCPTLWPLCPRTGSVLAMQPLCRSHDWTVVNHYYTQVWGLTMCFCGNAALTVCAHIVVTMLKTGSVLAMQPLCRSHGWTVVNHYCTQNWGLSMCFLRQCCTHSLCPTVWSQCSKTGSVLAMQPLCRSHGWTGGKSFIAHKTGVSPCVFCGNAATHCLCPTLWSQCSKIGSVLAMQPLCRSHGWTVVKHYYTQSWGLTVCFWRQCCTHSLCPHCGHCAQNWLGLGHAAFVQKSWLDCGKSLLHTKLGSNHVFFAAMLHSLLVPHIVVTMLQNWLGLGHTSFVQKSWLDCGKALLHTKLGSHRVFLAAMLHSQFVPHIVATVPQNWLGLGHAAFVQKS